MCHRIICDTCGKYNWEGCGLHIAEALAGLRMDQICRCDDDYDSEHPFTLPTELSTLTSLAATGQPRTDTTLAGNTSNVPPSPAAAAVTTLVSSDHPCESPAPVSDSNPLTPSAEIQYRLSKISSTSADLAAIRHAQQQAALEELQRIQDLQKAKLKRANENALHRLLGGLKDAVNEDEAPTGN